MAMSLSSAPVLSPPSEWAGRDPQIEVSVREAPEEMVVRVVGEASVRLADALARILFRLSVRRPKLVTLDLSGLHHLSSLAMGSLVAFHRGIVRGGGRVRLAVGLQGPVRASLERAGLLTLFGSAEGPASAPPVTTTRLLPDPGKAQV
jgi:anti-anti-sigma factor